MHDRFKYEFDGSVMLFDTCVVPRWTAETMAESEAKARSNFEYQYKKQNNLAPGARITLVGTIRII